MDRSSEEEMRICQVVEAIDDQEPAGVLRGDMQTQLPIWASDFTVNAPNNEVLCLAEVLDRMQQQKGLQYSSFERHREAIVVRSTYAVTMGYEIVVPKGDVPNAGNMINRRYLTCTRPSLVFDLMEPLRPLVDAKVIGLLQSHVFSRADFPIGRDGVVRLHPQLARVVSAVKLDGVVIDSTLDNFISEVRNGQTNIVCG